MGKDGRAAVVIQAFVLGVGSVSKSVDLHLAQRDGHWIDVDVFAAISVHPDAFAPVCRIGPAAQGLRAVFPCLAAARSDVAKPNALFR